MIGSVGCYPIQKTNAIELAQRWEIDLQKANFAPIMAASKYYAIQFPGRSQIVTSWAECEKLVHGVKGVLFKSFANRAQAEAWLSGVGEVNPPGLRIYVDGSFQGGCSYAGWGWVAVDEGLEIASDYGLSSEPAESRNIDGELIASYQAMKWLAQNGRNGVICHDYEGIARWAKGEWAAKSRVAQRYIAAIQTIKQWAKFEKVAAHTGDIWNEKVDGLAKKAIEEWKKKKG